MTSPYSPMKPGYFNSFIAGHDAAAQAREESELRQVEKQSNLSLIAERLQKMRDFDEARKSRLAKYGYDEQYYGAKAPLASQEAGYDVSKKGLDNQTASFELRKKRNELMKSMMPAIMRMRQTNPEGAAKLYNRLFGEKGLYGPGAGLSMGEAGEVSDPLQDPHHQQNVAMEQERRNTAAAGRAGTQRNWKEQKQWEAANAKVTVSDPEGKTHVMTFEQAQDYVAEAPGARILGPAGPYNPSTAGRQEYTAAKNLATAIEREIDRVLPANQGKISKANVATLKASVDEWRVQAAQIGDPNLRTRIEDKINRMEILIPHLEKAAAENLTKAEFMERLGIGPQPTSGASSNGFTIKR